MRRRRRTRATEEGEEETRTRWRVVARSSTSLARSRPSAAVVPRVNSTAAVARVNPRQRSRPPPRVPVSSEKSRRSGFPPLIARAHVCRPPSAGHYATTRTLLCTLLRAYPLRSTEHRGTHVSPRVTRACTRVARARSKPVGRLAGTGDENLASASRCRPPDSRSKLSLSPAALTLRARFTPNFLPGPLSRSPRVLTLRAHTARFSTKLSRRVGTRRSLPLPLHHRHHYHRRHR